MIHASPLPEVEIPDLPLTDYVLARAEELGDKPALIDGPSGRTLTYGGLLQGVRALAGGLVARGFEPGQTLALLSPNIPEYAIVFHGVAYAGGVVTTINPTYVEREIHHQLVDADARLLVTVAPFLDVARAAAEGTAVEEIFVIGQAEGARPITDLMGPPLTEQVPVDADDTVVLPYSSGTTGISKGVMLTHRNLVANVAQTLGAAEMREDETIVAVLPFFHIYGMQVLMNCGLRAGATIVTLPRFELEQFFSVHQEYGVTRSFVAPPIVVAMAKHPLVDNYDMSKLEQVFSGAAPLSAELALEAGQAPRLRGRPGVRHDRAVTGLAPHPRRPVQAGVRRCHRAQHRDAHRRPADRRRPRRRRRRRDLGPRSAGDEGLPQQRAGDRRHDHRRRAGCAPATSGTSTPTATCSSSTGSRSSSSTRASRWPRPSWRPCCSPIRPSRTPP